MKKTSEHPATQRHNHIRAIIQVLECLSIMELESELISFYVQHSDWCHIFKNEFCNCDPQVSMVPPGFTKLRTALLKRTRELKGMST